MPAVALDVDHDAGEPGPVLDRALQPVQALGAVALARLQVHQAAHHRLGIRFEAGDPTSPKVKGGPLSSVSFRSALAASASTIASLTAIAPAA